MNELPDYLQSFLSCTEIEKNINTLVIEYNNLPKNSSERIKIFQKYLDEVNNNIWD